MGINLMLQFRLEQDIHKCYDSIEQVNAFKKTDFIVRINYILLKKKESIIEDSTIPHLPKFAT